MTEEEKKQAEKFAEKFEKFLLSVEKIAQAQIIIDKNVKAISDHLNGQTKLLNKNLELLGKDISAIFKTLESFGMLAWTESEDENNKFH